MITRQEAEHRASNFVNITAIPPELRHPIVDYLSRVEVDRYESRSAMIRAFVTLPEFAGIMNLPRDQIAAICRCSPTLVHKVLTASETGETVMQRGRPAILSNDSMEALTEWVRSRTERMEWITVREFKGRVVDLLEQQGVENYPTTQFYRDLLDRLDGGKYHRVMAAPLEEERFNLSRESIEHYFTSLVRAGIQDMRPELIINLDETGFGASRSHRLKGIQVITPKSYDQKPCVAISTGHVYVSAIAAIMASGDSLPPGLVVRRTTMTEEFERIPVGRHVKIYTTEKAFVTRNVFENYVMEVIIAYLNNWRASNGCEYAKAMIILDGHSSHLSTELEAVCALHNTVLMVLPPHSSHLLQPLDRLYFSKVKQAYAASTAAASMSETSRQLLRVAMAFEASRVAYTICTSWSMTGIVPVIDKREAVGVRLVPEAINNETSLQHAFSGNQRERGTRNERVMWGLLNEDQRLIYEAGQCPFCFAVLPPDWEHP